MISVHFQGKPFCITVIQVYALTKNAKEAEAEWFHEDIKDIIELTHTKKERCPFHHMGLECKSRKSTDTWKTGKFCLEVQKETGLKKFCQENALVIANTLFQQHRRQLFTWI